MKKLVTSLLFGILLINASALFAQVDSAKYYQNRINALKKDYATLYKQSQQIDDQIYELERQNYILGWKLESVSDNLVEENKKLDAFLKRDKQAKEDNAHKAFEKQVRADLKAMSKAEFCEKYGKKSEFYDLPFYNFKSFHTFQGVYLRVHENTAITPLQKIVK